MMKKKALFLTLCCSTVLIGCSQQPKQEDTPPPSAMELAQQGLNDNSRLLNPNGAANVETGVIKVLPQNEPVRLKQVNQRGKAPSIPTLNAQQPSADFKNIDKNSTISFNGDVELRELLEGMADILNLNVLLDPAIGKEKVNLRTAENKNLTPNEIWSLLLLVIQDFGIEMEKKGAVYHFKKVKPFIPSTIGMPSSQLTNSKKPEVFQMTPLKHISVEAAQAILKPLIEPQGRIVTVNSLNALGIATTPDRLQRVNSLISLLDADPFTHRGMRLYRLANSKAEEVKTELEKVLAAVTGNASAVKPAYQVVALDRVNAILVVSPPNAGFEEVSLWIDILDERSANSSEQIFIYKVKNLEAKELATTLTEVFEVADDDEEEERKRKQKEQASTKEKKLPSQLPLNVKDNAKALAKENNSTSTSTTGAVSAELNVRIVADESTNSLIIRATPRDYRQLLTTITRLDEIPKEVMVNVVIAEVELTDTTKFGIDWQSVLGGNHGTYGTNLGVPTGNFPANVVPSSDGDTTTPTSVGGLTGFTISYASHSLKALLNLVAEKSNVTVLSRPSILVRNNEEATFNVGSSEPVITRVNSSSTTNQQLSNDVQYKDVGVNLQVTPRINDDGIINMKISQEVSQVGAERNNMPSFKQRKIESIVVVRNGTPIVVGGLIETRGNNAHNGILGLQDIPVVGDTLFSSKSDTQSRVELVLIIIPEIVNPVANNDPLIKQFENRMGAVKTLLEDENIQFNLSPINK